MYRDEGSNIEEQRETNLNAVLDDIRLSHSGEAEEPEYGVRHTLQYIDPYVQRGRVDLIQLIEVAEDAGVLGEAVLAARGDQGVVRHLLASGSLAVSLSSGQTILNDDTLHLGSNLVVVDHILDTGSRQL